MSVETLAKVAAAEEQILIIEFELQRRFAQPVQPSPEYVARQQCRMSELRADILIARDGEAAAHDINSSSSAFPLNSNSERPWIAADDHMEASASFVAMQNALHDPDDMAYKSLLLKHIIQYDVQSKERSLLHVLPRVSQMLPVSARHLPVAAMSAAANSSVVAETFSSSSSSLLDRNQLGTIGDSENSEEEEEKHSSSFPQRASLLPSEVAIKAHEAVAINPCASAAHANTLAPLSADMHSQSSTSLIAHGVDSLMSKLELNQTKQLEDVPNIPTLPQASATDAIRQ